MTGRWLVTGAAYGAALAWAGRLVAARTLFPRLPEVLARLGRV